MRAADLNTRIQLLEWSSSEFDPTAKLLTSQSITVWAAIKSKSAAKFSNEIHIYRSCFEVIIRRLQPNSKSFEYNKCIIDDQVYEIQSVEFVENNFIKFEAVKI